MSSATAKPIEQHSGSLIGRIRREQAFVLSDEREPSPGQALGEALTARRRSQRGPLNAQHEEPSELAPRPDMRVGSPPPAYRGRLEPRDDCRA